MLKIFVVGFLMIVIDKDPNTMVPNIHERYLHEKVITIYLDASLSVYRQDYCGILLPDTRTVINQYAWKGGSIDYHDTAYWSIPSNNKLIELLCLAWKEVSNYYKITVYVLDSIKELQDYLDVHNITNTSFIMNSKSYLIAINQSNHH